MDIWNFVFLHVSRKSVSFDRKD